MTTWIGTIASICLLLTVTVHSRNVPYHELDDDFYTEIRNILEDHVSQKIAPNIAHPREIRRWGVNIPLGQVTGVSVDPDGNPVIIHRGENEWKSDSFNMSESYQMNKPIKEHVVLTLDQRSGDVIKSWGAGKFFLPHGIFVDPEGNVWITDVALHQVFKFPPNSETPSLTLGERLVPGSDEKHFCKPTAVAVTSEGDFFVADGYCNARILHFAKDGSIIGQHGHFGHVREKSSLHVPHGLALHEATDILCIADREHARITCIKAGIKDHKTFGKIVTEILEPDRIRVFALAFSGDALVGVGGSEAEGVSLGFTADIANEVFVDQWAPIQGFHNPHSIATDQTGESIYIAEIGPNRVWKMTVEPSEDIY